MIDALAVYFFLSFTCVSALAAADLAALEDFGSASTLLALDAAFLPVVSFFPMWDSFRIGGIAEWADPSCVPDFAR